MDMYELLAQDDKERTTDEESVFGRIRILIDEQFTFKKFTSDQVRDAFQDRYNQPIKLAEISTYLARMTDLQEVNRVRRGRKWLYTLPSLTAASQAIDDRRAQFRRIIER